MDEASKIKVFLVDDSPVIRKWIRTEVESNSQIEVVGEAGSGEEAVEQAGRLQPDLVLMDIGLPGMNGLEATRRLRAEWPAMKVVILTIYADPEYAQQARRWGACGYLLKTAANLELASVLQAVQRGEEVF